MVAPAAMDKDSMVAALREKVSGLPPLVDEPDFITSEETLVRFLVATGWNLKEAEKNLSHTVEYRRRTRPLTVDCGWCHRQPGYHSMRQVGHDLFGRPVVYSNFAQASCRSNTTEDCVSHVTYLIESAKWTMGKGVSTWVFVIDCTGMTLKACNPKLGYSLGNVLSSHYPERLGRVICLNHSAVFHGVWKTLKKLLPPGTVAKMSMVRSDSKVRATLTSMFSPELSAWLLDEIALNRQKPLPTAQRQFWAPPTSPSDHDPRGCPSYVQRHLTRPLRRPEQGAREDRHRPHPNIVDALSCGPAHRGPLGRDGEEASSQSAGGQLQLPQGIGGNPVHHHHLHQPYDDIKHGNNHITDADDEMVDFDDDDSDDNTSDNDDNEDDNSELSFEIPVSVPSKTM